MSYQVLVKEVEQSPVLRTRVHAPVAGIGEAVESAVEQLVDRAAHDGFEPAGPPEVTYLGEFPPGDAGDTEIEVCLPVDGNVEHGPVDHGADLPTGLPAGVITRPRQRVAHTFHHGSYDNIGEAYQALFDWVRSAGYQVAGPPTEVYLVGPEQRPAPGDYVTEILVPISP